MLVCRGGGGAREEESRERPQEGGNSIVVSAYFPSPLRLDITGHTTAFVRPLPHTQIKKKNIYIPSHLHKKVCGEKSYVVLTEPASVSDYPLLCCLYILSLKVECGSPRQNEDLFNFNCYSVHLRNNPEDRMHMND